LHRCLMIQFFTFGSIITPVIHILCCYYAVSFSLLPSEPKYLDSLAFDTSQSANFANYVTYRRVASQVFQKPKVLRSALYDARVVSRDVDKNTASNTSSNSAGRLKIAAERYIVPGDYVVNEDYGIGRYLGIRYVHISPASVKPSHSYAERMKKSVPMVVVQFDDAEVSWFQKFAEKQLWVYRSADSGMQLLSSVLDKKKWTRRKRSARQRSEGMAIELMSLMAIRNSAYRPPCPPDDERYKKFENSFTFEPTNDQIECFQAIENDMVYRTRPMDRLVCGDVGFGKTEVAMRAIYRAVLAGRQVALLAPTRVLAKQHERTLKTRMPDVNVQLLRSSARKNNSWKVKEELSDGTCQVVVGTHTLLSPNVSFSHLGLLVIDEEQRFGVYHKEKLKSVSASTDVLTMSATPIPRTLQMSLSGLRDFSQMNTPPKGRLEVKVQVGPERLDVIKSAIELELLRGGQVFIVVPLIRQVDPTRRMVEAIFDEYNEKNLDVKIIEAHGDHKDLEDRIDAFTRGEGNVLIATTVIENGVDMPNVNTIIILSANRLGISSLYQLRGRVGRSNRQAYAYVMTSQNATLTPEAEQRLMYLQTFTALGSGYELSRRDMEMRGSGTLFGADQSGSQDVGIDLQAQMLSTALEEMKKNLTISGDGGVVGSGLTAVGIAAWAADEQEKLELLNRLELNAESEIAD